ncbi:MAG TPA: hypothetical protein ACFYD3_05545 [Candidatus Hypogeohydataceae bacterium YC41]
MRLLLSILSLFCFFWIDGLVVLVAKDAITTVTLNGKGMVVKKQEVEMIHVEGKAEGYITGTFVWEEKHGLAPEPEEAVEKGTITITDRNGDTILLNFSGRADLKSAGKATLESAQGNFIYREGTGHWANLPLSGDYTKAGVFKDDSVELSITLTVEVD